MSYTTLTRSTNDQALRDRVQAAVNKEAADNPALSDTPYGHRVRDDPMSAWADLLWPVCIANEAAYESALIAGNPDPGGDPAVITDASILSAVQADWPDA